MTTTPHVLARLLGSLLTMTMFILIKLQVPLIIGLQTSVELDCWIIDSGANDHMTNKVSNLHDFHPFSKPSQVSIANGKKCFGDGQRKMKFDVKKH